jgi:hypothetical protein
MRPFRMEGFFVLCGYKATRNKMCGKSHAECFSSSILNRDLH